MKVCTMFDLRLRAESDFIIIIIIFIIIIIVEYIVCKSLKGNDKMYNTWIYIYNYAPLFRHDRAAP